MEELCIDIRDALPKKLDNRSMGKVKQSLKTSLAAVQERCEVAQLMNNSSGAVIKKSTSILNLLLDILIAVSDQGKKATSFMVSTCTIQFLDLVQNDLVPLLTKTEVLNRLNMVLESTEIPVKKQLVETKFCKSRFEKLFQLIFGAGDYEFQVMLVEFFYRLLPQKTRQKYCELFVKDKALMQAFLNIRDVCFEVDCRLFLNQVNKSSREIKVHSFPCNKITFGSVELQKPSDPGYDDFWLDVNSGSRRILIFCENAQLSSEVSCSEDCWDTVSVRQADVDKFVYEEKQGLLYTKVYMKAKASCIPVSWEHDTRHILSIVMDAKYDFKNALSLAFGLKKASDAAMPIPCYISDSASQEKSCSQHDKNKDFEMDYEQDKEREDTPFSGTKAMRAMKMSEPTEVMSTPASTITLDFLVNACDEKGQRQGDGTPPQQHATDMMLPPSSKTRNSGRTRNVQPPNLSLVRLAAQAATNGQADKVADLEQDTVIPDSMPLSPQTQRPSETSRKVSESSNPKDLRCKPKTNKYKQPKQTENQQLTCTDQARKPIEGAMQNPNVNLRSPKNKALDAQSSSAQNSGRNLRSSLNKVSVSASQSFNQAKKPRAAKKTKKKPADSNKNITQSDRNITADTNNKEDLQVDTENCTRLKDAPDISSSFEEFKATKHKTTRSMNRSTALRSSARLSGKEGRSLHKQSSPCVEISAKEPRSKQMLKTHNLALLQVPNISSCQTKMGADAKKVGEKLIKQPKSSDSTKILFTGGKDWREKTVGSRIEIPPKSTGNFTPSRQRRLEANLSVSIEDTDAHNTHVYLCTGADVAAAKNMNSLLSALRAGPLQTGSDRFTYGQVGSSTDKETAPAAGEKSCSDEDHTEDIENLLQAPKAIFFEKRTNIFSEDQVSSSSDKETGRVARERGGAGADQTAAMEMANMLSARKTNPWQKRTDSSTQKQVGSSRDKETAIAVLEQSCTGADLSAAKNAAKDTESLLPALSSHPSQNHTNSSAKRQKGSTTDVKTIHAETKYSSSKTKPNVVTAKIQGGMCLNEQFEFDEIEVVRSSTITIGHQTPTINPLQTNTSGYNSKQHNQDFQSMLNMDSAVRISERPHKMYDEESNNGSVNYCFDIEIDLTQEDDNLKATVHNEAEENVNTEKQSVDCRCSRTVLNSPGQFEITLRGKETATGNALKSSKNRKTSTTIISAANMSSNCLAVEDDADEDDALYYQFDVDTPLESPMPCPVKTKTPSSTRTATVQKSVLKTISSKPTPGSSNRKMLHFEEPVKQTKRKAGSKTGNATKLSDSDDLYNEKQCVGHAEEICRQSNHADNIFSDLSPSKDIQAVNSKTYSSEYKSKTSTKANSLPGRINMEDLSDSYHCLRKRQPISYKEPSEHDLSVETESTVYRPKAKSKPNPKLSNSKYILTHQEERMQVKQKGKVQKIPTLSIASRRENGDLSDPYNFEEESLNLADSVITSKLDKTPQRIQSTNNVQVKHTSVLSKTQPSHLGNDLRSCKQSAKRNRKDKVTPTGQSNAFSWDVNKHDAESKVKNGLHDKSMQRKQSEKLERKRFNVVGTFGEKEDEEFSPVKFASPDPHRLPGSSSSDSQKEASPHLLFYSQKSKKACSKMAGRFSLPKTSTQERWRTRRKSTDSTTKYAKHKKTNKEVELQQISPEDSDSETVQTSKSETSWIKKAKQSSAAADMSAVKNKKTYKRKPYYVADKTASMAFSPDMSSDFELVDASPVRQSLSATPWQKGRHTNSPHTNDIYTLMWGSGDVSDHPLLSGTLDKAAETDLGILCQESSMTNINLPASPTEIFVGLTASPTETFVDLTASPTERELQHGAESSPVHNGAASCHRVMAPPRRSKEATRKKLMQAQKDEESDKTDTESDEKTESERKLLKRQGLLSGPSSIVRPSQSALKRTFLTVGFPASSPMSGSSDESDGEAIAANGKRKCLQPRKLFSNERKAMEWKSCKQRSRTRKMPECVNNETVISKCFGVATVHSDEHKDIAELEDNDLGSLETVTISVSSDDVLSQNDLPVKIDEPVKEVATLLKGFGFDLQKQIKERKQQVQDLAKGMLQLSSKHFQDFWTADRNRRQQVIDNFQTHNKTQLTSMETAVDGLNEIQKKAEATFLQGITLLQQLQNKLQSKVQSLKASHVEFRSETEQIDRCCNKDQKSMEKKMKEDMEQLRKKMLLDMQQQQLRRVKESFKKHFF